MVLPVTANTDKVIARNITGAGSFYDYRSRTKQGKPYTEIGAYTRKRRDILSARYGGTYDSYASYQNANVSSSPPYADLTAYWDPDLSNTNPVVNGLLTKAREEFRDKVGESAEVLVNLAERKQAASMMGNRLEQIADVLKALRRGNPTVAFDLLMRANTRRGLATYKDGFYHRRKGRTYKPKIVINPRNLSRDLSGFWLETWFGWGPLIGDIASAMELLESPIKSVQVRTGARQDTRSEVRRKLISAGAYGDIRHTWMHNVNWKVNVGAEVAVSNPNLYLWQSLGFTNLPGLAWELIPWSFIVDWFVNVNSWLSQWTELHGLTIQRPYYNVSCHDVCYGYDAYFDYTSRVSSWYETVSRQHMFRRQPGLPSLALGFRKPWKLSLTRALTASSLIIQLGIKK